MANSSPIQTSEIDLVCQFCNEPKLTDWICSHCNKHHCDECKKVNLQVNTEHDHENSTIKDNSKPELYTSQESLRAKTKSVQCEQHCEYNHTNYCVECNELVCPQCLATSHRKHEVEVIKKFCEDSMEKLESYQNMMEQYLLPLITEKIKTLNCLKQEHERKFEEEQKKILEQDAILKQKITECTTKFLQQLKQNFDKKSDKISKERTKMENIELELKEKVIQLKESKMKDGVDEIKVDVKNLSDYVDHCDTSVKLPQIVRTFCPGEINEEKISELFGCLQRIHLAGEVELKVLKSYDYGKSMGSRSLTVSKDDTVWRGDRDGLIQIKLGEEPRKIEGITNIADIAVTKSGEFLFAVENDGNVKIKNNVDKTKTFFTIPGKNSHVLAIHISRFGRIIVLYCNTKHRSSFMSLKDAVDLNVVVLSKDAKQIKMFRCGGQYKRSSNYLWLNRFRISENINGQICMSCLYNEKVVNLDQDGNIVWDYWYKRGSFNPYDVVTTTLGNIIINNLLSFLVLDCDGNAIRCVKFPDIRNRIYNLCMKNDRELLVVSTTKVHIMELSTLI